MKRSHILGGVAALASSALALGAAAGGVAAAQQAPQTAERVSRADFVDQRLARVTAMDANSDGAIAPEEARDARDARRAGRSAERFAKLDVNGDGSLSRAEFDAGHAERVQHREARRGPGGPGERGSRPGRVDRAERTMTVADARTRAERAFDRLDKDRDGYVTREERQDGRRAGRGGHRGGRGPADAFAPVAQE